MIKGLFFDFDGVITMEKEGSPTIISYISKETNIPYETIANILHHLFINLIEQVNCFKCFFAVSALPVTITLLCFFME